MSSSSGDASNTKHTKIPTVAESPASLYSEKLIPDNVVPDIVELLVTLGLIQREATADNNGTTVRQPRFAVHFGKPKQFLVTPTNILSEIAKAQAEIQASRQRQELLEEALGLSDQLAAEKVKQIVLQHPQVVDDPVYVTALRNLQVDGMLIAGASGAAAAGGSSSSSSAPNRGGTGASSKKAAAGKRRQSSGAAPAKRKRQRARKEARAESIDATGAPVPPPGGAAGGSSGTKNTAGSPSATEALPAGAVSISGGTSASKPSFSVSDDRSKNKQ